MRTVQEIFDKAIHLIDAQNESTGSTHTTDTKEYEVRCFECLNTLLNEAYPYSDNAVAEKYDSAAAVNAGDSVTSGGWRYLCIADAPAGTAITDTDYFTKTAKAGRRPVHPPVTAFTDTVFMDDFICMSALPAGLAALFTYDEDTTKYNAFWGDYMNRLAQAKATLPAADGFEDIENPYSFDGMGAGIEYGEFGEWANM